MDEEGIKTWSSEDESMGLQLKDKPPTQASEGSKGSVRSAFAPEKVVIGAS